MNNDGRRPKRYIPGYDMPDYAEGLLRFLGGRRRGRPPLSQQIKMENRKRKVATVLVDIWRLNLTTVKSNSWIAGRLQRKFPEKYPPARLTRRPVKTSLRKDVAAAMKYLRENASHPNLHAGFSRLLKLMQKQSAK